MRVTRNVRNDGTFPGLERGVLLVPRGSAGFVRDIGIFLQDRIIYAVHFLDVRRVVGCREEELIPAAALWSPNRFEFRDKVRARVPLAIGGNLAVAQGTEGEIIRVLREHPGGTHYQVRFPGRSLEVPESALASVLPATAKRKSEDPENYLSIQ